MKFSKFAASLPVFFLSAVTAFAVPFSVISADGQQVSIDIPSDAYQLVVEHQADIIKAIQEYNVTASDIREAESALQDAYKNIKNHISTDSPITTVLNGMNEMTDNIVDAMPDSLAMQGIYSDAWIGMLIPKVHFGAGVNVSASTIDITPMKNVAKALDITFDNLPDKFVFPTIAADIRLGGIILPFDIGFSFIKFDTSKYSQIDSALSPSAFDYLTIGGEFRYALLKGGKLRPKISVGGGYYYSKGSLTISDEKADANLDFSTQIGFAEAQASIKLLFFTPFVGTRLMYAKSGIDWSARAQWDKIISNSGDSYADGIRKAQAWGFLPSKISGESSGTSFRPIIFGGFGIDLFVMSLTISASYDFVSRIPSAAASFRISW